MRLRLSGETAAESAGGRVGLRISSFYLLISLFSRRGTVFPPGDIVLGRVTG